eukprot:gene22379-biopygen17732
MWCGKSGACGAIIVCNFSAPDLTFRRRLWCYFSGSSRPQLSPAWQQEGGLRYIRFEVRVTKADKTAQCPTCFFCTQRYTADHLVRKDHRKLTHLCKCTCFSSEPQDIHVFEHEHNFLKKLILTHCPQHTQQTGAETTSYAKNGAFEDGVHPFLLAARGQRQNIFDMYSDYTPSGFTSLVSNIPVLRDCGLAFDNPLRSPLDLRQQTALPECVPALNTGEVFMVERRADRPPALPRRRGVQ